MLYLDRLLHHSHVFKIIGESYRLKNVIKIDKDTEFSDSLI
ncbi:MAG: ATP-binding protein [Mycoplasmatales bacterium]